GDPGLQLAWLVEITEFFCGSDSLLLPGLPVAAVKAHHTERGGHCYHRRHTRGKALRLIDDHIGEAMILEKFQDARTPVVFHPQDLAELDSDTEIRKPLPEVLHESIRGR